MKTAIEMICAFALVAFLPGCGSEPTETPAQPVASHQSTDLPAPAIAKPEPVAAPPLASREPARPTVDDPNTWGEVRSTGLGFSVRMPPLDDVPRDLDAASSTNLYSRPEGMEGPWFSVSVHPTFRSPRDLRSAGQVERFLEGHADRAANFDPWGRPSYLGGRSETLYGHPGYVAAEIVNEPYPGARRATIRTRVVLVGERVFVLQARTRGPRPSTEVVEAFFNSFELLAEAAPSGP